MTDCLFDGPDEAAASFFFAHGAGAPMDSDFMSAIAAGLGTAGLRVIRFEFPYMAARRDGGSKRPPPRAETLTAFFADLVRTTPAPGRIFIGGKSMGGRIASLFVDELHASGTCHGLVCLGYPFHPPGKPDRLRTAHLEALQTSALICQGERDPFGSREEAAAYSLSHSIEFAWLADGDHSFAPRKASGRTVEENYAQAVDAIARFCRAGG